MIEKLNLFQNVTPLNRRFTFLGGTRIVQYLYELYIICNK